MPRNIIIKIIHYSAMTIYLWLKRAGFIVVLLLIGYATYHLFIKDIIDRNNLLIGFLGVWVVLAYIALPLINRKLAQRFIPDYYIGRVRTSDGLLGDPVNIAVNGSQKSLVGAMKKAGWTQADPITFKNSIRIIFAVITRKSYPTAPVSSLFLFGNKQNFAFQQEVAGNPNRRHHVRFWKTPSGWILPGGHKVDWLAAGTYDKSVGFSAYTLQITHKIAENTDQERDYIVDSLKNASVAANIHIITHYSTGYHSRNGGGDSIKTDGALPIITLK